MKASALFDKPKPEDTRLRVPCTSLEAVLASLEAQGKRVLAMERKRDKSQVTYLLTVSEK